MQNLDHNIGDREKRQFFRRKSQKIVIIKHRPRFFEQNSVPELARPDLS
jgi:hypothetical protein